MILAPRLSALATDSYLDREDLRIGMGRFLPRHRASGQALDPRLPVTGISRNDIAAYIRWRRQRDGIAWRLPTDPEWQIAASGGDQRGVRVGQLPRSRTHRFGCESWR